MQKRLIFLLLFWYSIPSFAQTAPDTLEAKSYQTSTPQLDDQFLKPTEKQTVDSLMNTFSSLSNIENKEDYKKELLKKTMDVLTHNQLSSKLYLKSQFFLITDLTNQQLSLGFYNVKDNSITISDKSTQISSGNDSIKGHFKTPSGVFEPESSYRAKGTKNSEGLRGIGTTGQRVWDFGWQETTQKNGKTRLIRLEMHSTDPSFYSLLGSPQSKGCVRVPNAINEFIDKNQILDAEYSKSNHFKWLGTSEVSPDLMAIKGSLMIVVD